MKAEIKFAAKCIVVGAAIAAASLFLRSAPKAQPTLSLPFATVTSVTSAGQQIIGANPSRRAISICLAAVAQSVTFIPAPATPASLTSGITIFGSATVPPPCFTSPTLTASGTSGGVGAAWNAISSGTINVTVLEW
jgi:hypothetical protein